jgi:hypothetical protein
VQGQQTGNTQGDVAKKTPPKIELTSGQLKQRLEEAKALERKTLLESLGVSDESTLKGLVERQRQKEESEKSETQKLSDLVTTLQKQLTEKDQKLVEAEATRRVSLRDSELKSLLSKAHDPNQVLILLKASQGEKLNDLLSEDGKFDTEAAQKLVSEYQKDNGFLFKDGRPGSAMSNRDGRSPEPNKDAKADAAKRTFRNMRNNI